jgi:hypothetical protein
MQSNIAKYNKYKSKNNKKYNKIGGSPKNSLDHIPTIQRFILYNVPKNIPLKPKVQKLVNLLNVNSTWNETLMEHGYYIMMELGLFNIHSLFEFAKLNFVSGIDIILSKYTDESLQLIDNDGKLVLYYVTNYKIFNYLKDKYLNLMTMTGKTKQNYWHNILDKSLKNNDFWEQMLEDLDNDTFKLHFLLSKWREKDYEKRNCWFYAAKNINSEKFWIGIANYNDKKLIFDDWTDTDVNKDNVWMAIASNDKINNSKFWESAMENSNNFEKWTNDIWKIMAKNIKNIKFWEQFISKIPYIQEYEKQFKFWNIDTFLNAINNRVVYKNENKSLIYLIFKIFEEHNYDYKHIVVDILQYYLDTKKDYKYSFDITEKYIPRIYKTIFSFNDEITNFAFDYVFGKTSDDNDLHKNFLNAIRFSVDNNIIISSDNDVIILLRSDKTREWTIVNALQNLLYNDGDNGSYGGPGRKYLTENVFNKIAEWDLFNFDIFSVERSCPKNVNNPSAGYTKCKLNIIEYAILGNTKQYWDYISTKLNYEQLKTDFSFDYNHYRINIYSLLMNIDSDDFWRKIFSIVSRKIDSDDEKDILEYMAKTLRIPLTENKRELDDTNIKSQFLKDAYDKFGDERWFW